MSALLAAVAGALLAGGLVALVAGLRRRPPPTAEQLARPPTRAQAMLNAPFAADRRKRTLIAFGVGLALLLLTRWPIAAVAGVVAVLMLPRLMSGRSAEQRIERLEAIEQWARKLGDVLGASRGLEDALMLSVRNAPDAIAPEIETLARRLRARMNTERALRLFADDLDDSVGDLVVCALTLAASRRGPGLRAVLTNLAGMVATEVSNRRQIEAERATHRTTIRWVAVFLGAFTIFVTVRSDYSEPYDTAMGQLVLAVVLGMYGLALWWLHRLSTAAPNARFLTADAKLGSGAAGATTARQVVS